MSQTSILNIKNQQEKLLAEIWKGMFYELTGSLDPFPELFNKIIKAYQEKHRKYHILSHLLYCFKELESVRSLLHSPLTVMFAIWYHDIVYDTCMQNNEEESALAAKQALREMGLFSENFINKVVQMILASKHTSHHGSNDNDTLFFLDIDLSILGADEETFDAYEKQIRLEYFWVELSAYKRGRTAVLESILKNKPILKTEQFNTKCGKQAEMNLKRSLAALHS